jgi:hypothetical protein
VSVSSPVSVPLRCSTGVVFKHITWRSTMMTLRERADGFGIASQITVDSGQGPHELAVLQSAHSQSSPPIGPFAQQGPPSELGVFFSPYRPRSGLISAI